MTTTTIPATNKSGFPITACGRCGGSGRYSYNTMHGDMCYGCSGSGVVIARRALAAWNDYVTAVRAARRPVLGDVVAGDRLWVTGDAGDERIQSEKCPGGRWATVEAVEIGTREMGWSLRDGERIVTAWECTVTVQGGTTQTMATNHIVRRHGDVDAAPFVARIAPARR